MLVSPPPCLMHELLMPKEPTSSSRYTFKVNAAGSGSSSTPMSSLSPTPLPSPGGDCSGDSSEDSYSGGSGSRCQSSPPCRSAFSPSLMSMEGTAATAAIVMPATDLTASLDAVLRSEKSYETPEGLVKRREVLKQLNVLVKQWIQSVSLTRGMHWSDIDKIGGSIVTYGSYKLGISHQGADIDALCIAPQHITRQEYFTSLLSLLSYQAQVTELRAIEEAYVPVLKMRYNGIEIDMTFARLNMPEVPSDPDFLADMNLSNLDAKCIRSLNGFRSTQELLRLVPNEDTFRMALRAIKLWAKGQGLYSNSLGYLGGFSWAVLVAKTCMLNPTAQAAELVFKFFELFSQWNWPNPVALTDYESKPSMVQQQQQSTGTTMHNVNGFLGHQQIYSWNPEKNPQEKHQVMPIITPTFPHLNSTFNVTPSTLKLIQDKMTKAFSLTKKIFNGEETWESLFQTHHIFDEYNHLLVVIATAKNYIQWFGLIESKIRHFLTSIEKDCYQTLHSARIWPKAFTKIGDSHSSVTQQLWFVGLEFLPSVTEVTPDKIEFSRALKSFQETLYSQARNFYHEDMGIIARYVHKTDLTGHLTDKEIQEIVSSQSQKREPTPPPSQPPSRTPSSALSDVPHLGGIEAMQVSEGFGPGGGQQQQQLHLQLPLPQQFFPASSGDSCSNGRGEPLLGPVGNVLSSPSYAAAVTKSSLSPSSSSSSSSCSGNGNNNYLVHKILPPLLPNLLGVGNIPPLPQQQQQTSLLHPPPSQQHQQQHNPRNYFSSSNGSGNIAPPMGGGGGNYHHHPNISHHHSYHINNHHYSAMHHHPHGSMLSRSPIMERTWNTQMAPTTSGGGGRNFGKGGGGGGSSNNTQQQSAQPSESTPASSSGPGGGGGGRRNQAQTAPASSTSMGTATVGGTSTTTSQAPTVNVCGSDSWSSSSLGGNGAANDFDLGGSTGESVLDASYSSMESENGRSVSFSSDKFPPQSLIQARLQHVDSKLLSSPSYNNYYTPYDVSVPPPSPISISSPAMTAGNGKGSVHGRGSNGQRHHSSRHSQRLSSSELRDVNTPMPIQRMHYQQLQFNFNPASIQQLQASSDSVFI